MFVVDYKLDNYEINTQIGKRIIENADYCLENLQAHAKSSKVSPVIL